MFYCYICNKHISFISRLNQVSSHLRNHRFLSGLKYPIKCCQNSCQSTFSLLSNYLQHFKKYHLDCLEPVQGHPEQGGCENENIDNLSHAFHSNSLKETESVDAVDPEIERAESAETISKLILSLVAELRANSSIPYSIIPTIVQSCNNIASIVIDLAVEQVKYHCKKANQTELLKLVTDSLEDIRQPFLNKISYYQINKEIEANELFVKPSSEVINSREERFLRKGQLTNVQVYNTYEYVSVTETLKALCKNPAFVAELISRPETKPGIIGHFCDGSVYKSLSEKSLQAQQIMVPIELFYDGMCITNPLRSGKAVTNEQGEFLYIFKNLKKHYNSAFPNVHLLGLANMLDLKEQDGLPTVLNKFMEEIKTLETTGIDIILPNGKPSKLYATLIQTACDNKALNSVLGFIESFSCDYFCTQCYATKDQIQECFTEKEFEMRTEESYQEDLNNLQQSPHTVRHVRGVKTKSPLLSENFHPVKNATNDCMHTVLEGVVPLEMACVLNELVNVNKDITLETLNEHLRFICSHMVVDSKNKPCAISAINVYATGASLSPSMTASQMWTLLRILPLALADEVDGENVFFQFLLHLSELVDLIFAPRFTVGMVKYLESLIEEHQSMFKEYFPTVPLKPKHHFLVHYPSNILKSGPPADSDCFKYELHNCGFKRSAHIVCNFQNSCKTLAYRHQNMAFYHTISGMNIREFVLTGQITEIPIGIYEHRHILKETIENLETDKVFVTKKLTLNGQVYMANEFVISDYHDKEKDTPIFAKIKSFINSGISDEWLLVLEKHDTLDFDEFKHSYKVCSSRNQFIQRFVDLVDFHPLDGIVWKHALYVRPKYHVFK